MDQTKCKDDPGGQPIGSLLRPWSADEAPAVWTAVCEFAVRDLARFLSHAQLVRIFQRACTRAGMNLAYSQGFNPRPKMSLPLPKGVGIASEADVVCLRLATLPEPFHAADAAGRVVQQALQSQLPTGIVVTRVTMVDKVNLYPVGVTYWIPLSPTQCRAQLTQRMKRILESSEWPVTRRRGAGKQSGKTVDVRPYIESLTLERNGLLVDSKVTPTGTIRTDEICHLLEIDAAQSPGAITRRAVTWKKR
jgi:radical SAM-linked protein